LVENVIFYIQKRRRRCKAVKKKTLALLMAVLMILSTLPTTALAAFSDTEGTKDWSVIKKWSDYGVLKGYEDGTFRPDSKITRGEFAAVVDRVLQLKAAGKNSFSDLGDTWHKDYILRMVAAGIMKGDIGGTIRPNDSISREEAFVMLDRAFSTTPTEAGLNKFTDSSEISQWAKAEVGGLAAYIDGTKLRAQEDITRAEVVSTIDSIVAGFFNKAGTFKDSIKGNAVVNTPGVVMEGAKISGNLYITQGVGKGDFTLKNSTIEGTMFVNGGGTNSVKIIGSVIKELKALVDPATGTVRIVVDEKSVTEKIYIDDGSDTVILEGKFKDVVVEGGAAVVVAEGTKVDNIRVEGDAATVEVRKGAEVKSVAINAGKAKVNGEGRVESVKVESGKENTVTVPGASVIVSKDAGSVFTGDGKNIPSGSTGTSQTESGNTSLPPASTGGGSSGGSSSDGDDHPAVTTMTIAADGVKGITDASYNYLFGGDAVKGIANLVAARAVKINGVTVPTVTSEGTYSADKLDINGGRGLWKNADGTWSWDVHVLFKGANKSYADAVVGFVNDVTKLRGISYKLTITGGTATGLEATVFDVALANTVTKGADNTTITIVEKGDNSTDKPDPSTIHFPNANVEGNPQSQDMVLYWKDSQGWHLKRATSEEVVVKVNITVANGKESISGTINGNAIMDSRLTLQYSEPWNRPSQPVRGMAWMGEDNVSAIQWTCAPGITVGFSRGAGAKDALQAAISKAEDALELVEVSDAGDGSDIASDKMWVTQAYHDIFAKAVADAQAVLDDADATNAEYEGALYRLAQAYGGRTGDRFSWLENTYFGKGDDYGRGAAVDTG
jgi:hypothetical protein